MPDPSLVPWWQWPTPPPTSFFIVRDAANSGPPLWSYWLPGVASVLTIAGAYFAAAMQAKGSLDAAIKSSETALSVAATNSEATMKAALAHIQATADAQRAAEESLQKREEAVRLRKERALRRQVISYLVRVLGVILAEAKRPEPAPSAAQREREIAVTRFIDASFDVDVVAAHEDKALDMLHAAGFSAQNALYRMLSIAGSQQPVEKKRLDDSIKLYITIATRLCMVLTELGATEQGQSGMALIEKLKLERSDLWAVTPDNVTPAADAELPS